MRRHRGEVIHQDRDSEGPLEVVQDHMIRALHFGSEARQSAMLLVHPTVLILAYTRALMSALLFQPAPARALLVGLGGGSLAKFLLHFFPDCQIEVAEPRTAVVELARHYFELPEDPRLQIHEVGGETLVKDHRRPPFDLIVVDAFDRVSMVEAVTTRAFYTACRQRLRPKGVLSINLWASHRAGYKRAWRDLEAAFDGQVLRLPVENHGNVIGLACEQAQIDNLEHLNDCAERLQDLTGLEFAEFIDRLRRHNGSLWRRLFG